MRKESGYTLLEMLLVLGLIALISAIAAPSIVQWRHNAVYKSAAQDLFAALQKARGLAIANNREYRVAVDIDNDRYLTQEGNRGANSNWPTTLDWSTGQEFPAEINLTRKNDCSDPTNAPQNAIYFSFNPNGTSSSEYICIMSGSEVRYQVAVPSSIVGIPKLCKGKCL